jgi:5-methylcytosine-specific restriction endonuclease McrA
VTGWNRRGSSTAWRQLRAAILDRDRWSCRVPVDVDDQGVDVLCGAFADTVGHLDPRATGGPLLAHPSRLRAECRRHNYGDGARLGNLLRRTRRTGDRGWSW